MIKLNNLSKYYGSTLALNNLNLEIDKGECFVFLGPNGAGKTTTIKLMTGLLRPSEGSIYINGYDINKDNIKAKSFISYVPDVPYLYDKLTGWEYLNFIARIYKMAEDQIESKINDLMELFNLEKYKYILIENYSHGIKQRLVICSSLIHNPKIIIVDEPMVALDPIAIRLVKDIFKQKVKEGVTIFMSTHTLSVAQEMATRIGIIDKANLIATGTINELSKKANSSKELEEIFIKLTDSNGKNENR